MKILIFSSVFLLLFSSKAKSQISFDPHPVEIDANVAEINEIKAPTASSSCGSVKIELDEKIFSGGCAGVLVREYKASDSCGNTASTTQFIHLKDTEAPIFINPVSEIQVAAGEEIPMLTPEINDSGKNIVSLTFEDQVLSDKINRIWTASDSCDNRSQFVQTIWTKAQL